MMSVGTELVPAAACVVTELHKVENFHFGGPQRTFLLSQTYETIQSIHPEPSPHCSAPSKEANLARSRR